MKSLLKNPLKMIVAGMFVVAISAGLSISPNMPQSANGISLSALMNNAIAQGESGDCPNGCLTPPGHCWCNGYHPYEEADWG